MIGRPVRWVRDHPWTILAVLVFATFFYAYKASQEARDTALRQTCTVIDADHNRERKQIIENEALIYTVPSFKALIPDRASERIAYDNAKHRYEAPRKTRPRYCDRLGVENPVAPFPPLSDFRSGKLVPTKVQRQAAAASEPSSGSLSPSAGRATTSPTVTPQPAQRPHAQPQTPSRPKPAQPAPNPTVSQPSPPFTAPPSAPDVTKPPSPVVSPICVTVPGQAPICTPPVG